MKQKLQCERAFSKEEADKGVLSVWDAMGLHENIARQEIIAAVERHTLNPPEDIWMEWTRQRDPRAFVLRAWCLVESKA